jgi:hypothetical protein
MLWEWNAVGRLGAVSDIREVDARAASREGARKLERGGGARVAPGNRRPQAHAPASQLRGRHGIRAGACGQHDHHVRERSQHRHDAQPPPPPPPPPHAGESADGQHAHERVEAAAIPRRPPLQHGASVVRAAPPNPNATQHGGHGGEPVPSQLLQGHAHARRRPLRLRRGGAEHVPLLQRRRLPGVHVSIGPHAGLRASALVRAAELGIQLQLRPSRPPRLHLTPIALRRRRKLP